MIPSKPRTLLLLLALATSPLAHALQTVTARDGETMATLDGIEDGSLTPAPQPAEGISVAPKITVDGARVRWDLPAHVVERRLRAVTPNPGAWTMIGDTRVKLGPVTLTEETDLAAGEIRVERNRVLVGTGSGAVQLGTVQPPGKKPMNAADWARGARLDVPRAS